MVIIKKLVRRSGVARAILSLEEDADGYIDISADDWKRSDLNIEHIKFHRMKLRKVSVGIKFNLCEFEKCSFEKVNADYTFFGGGNVWKSCKFKSVRLFDIVSPVNVFRGCEFSDVTLICYRPYQTLFENCKFDRIRIEGMRCRPVLNSGSRLKQLDASGGMLLFDKCVFNMPVFEKCYFDKVEFRQCQVIVPKVSFCSFKGIVMDKQWHSEEMEQDPFVKFVSEIVAFCEKRFGTQSASYKAISEYLLDYTSGRTESKDYSACLYEGAIPEKEMDVLEDELDKIEARVVL